MPPGSLASALGSGESIAQKTLRTSALNADDPALEKRVSLLDLLDRILQKGVVIQGDLTLSVADIDLVYVGLRVLLTSVEQAEKMRASPVLFGASEK
ncbi:gas vesicle protein [Candidatus Gracilibacteria bacterium]|nr:gas vesicle protein [Candidatus Gracilibacteria bacterium]